MVDEASVVLCLGVARTLVVELLRECRGTAVKHTDRLAGVLLRFVRENAAQLRASVNGARLQAGEGVGSGGSVGHQNGLHWII